jgi:Short C-terminal domain
MDGLEEGGRLRASLWIFVSLAGVSAGLTLLFLGMRAVMEIGGACASGGPFVPVRPCPEGVPLVMIGGIWGGFIFGGIYAWQTLKRRLPNVLGLLWPALFLSLGWNFLEYGLDPPGESGLAWGWLVCAIVFGLMGGLPLVVTLPATFRGFAGRQSERSRAGALDALRRVAPGWSAVRGAGKQPNPPINPPPTAPEEDEDVVSRLERLAALHQSGALDDAEFQDAKRRIIQERGD